MTKEELKKSHVIQCALEGKCTVAEAAVMLGLSERRVKQLKKEVKENGEQAVIHGNRGRKPTHAKEDELAKRIVEMKQSYKYREVNFLHFKDILEEYERIEISYSALYNILTKAGVKSTEKRRSITVGKGNRLRE